MYGFIVEGDLSSIPGSVSGASELFPLSASLVCTLAAISCQSAAAENERTLEQSTYTEKTASGEKLAPLQAFGEAIYWSSEVFPIRRSPKSTTCPRRPIALKTNPTSFFRPVNRSEERRVGKECRSRWSPY